MLGNFTSAFALTVLCLQPLLLAALVLTPLLMRLLNRNSTPAETPSGARRWFSRGFLASMTTFLLYFFVSLVVLVTITLGGWFTVLSVTGTEGTSELAIDTLNVDPTAVEEALAPAETLNAPPPTSAP